MPTVEIISQGDEVISGQIVDSNAAWLAEQLVLMGFDVQRHSTVGDDLEAILGCLAEACQRAELVICTGGLGPTQDDLTAEAVAQLTGQALQLDAQALRDIQARFAGWGRPMPAVNEKQAWLPAGAQRIDNPWGTAPGFSLCVERARIVCLPGVPSEMKALFEHSVVALLQRHFYLQPGQLVTFRTVGAGESSLQQRIGPFFHEHVTLSYRAMGREVQIKLRFDAACPAEQRAQHCATMQAVLGDDVFAIEGWGEYGSFELGERVLLTLQQQKKTLVLAESASAGRLTQLLKIPELEASPLAAAYYFDSPAQLAKLLVVTEQPEGFRQWAEVIQAIWAADFVLLTTPLVRVPAETNAAAGERSVFSATCVLVGRDEPILKTLRLTGTSTQNQQTLAYVSLDMLRRRLLGLSG